MSRLADFAAKWADAGDGFRCWLGDVGGVEEPERSVAIARKVGYAPQSEADFFPITRRTAARVMAYVQEQSLAYGERRYSEGRAADMLAILEELGPRAAFWSNSRHSDFEPASPAFTPDNARMWIAITEATFDTGVIAFNDTTGFIFWAEDED